MRRSGDGGIDGNAKGGEAGLPTLEPKLRRRIATYAAAGGAAALGASNAQATILYTDLPDVTLATNGATFDLDFDGDALGELDFQLQKSSYTTASSSTSSGNIFRRRFARANPASNLDPMRAAPMQPGGFFSTLPGALNSGDNISLAGNFDTRSGSLTNILATHYGRYGNYPCTFSAGNFLDTSSKFLGVRFDLADGTHFGWVQLSVPYDVSFLRIEAYAWETTPGQSIDAGQTVPEPSTLSLLALGTVVGAGVAWRRDRDPRP